MIGGFTVVVPTKTFLFYRQQKQSKKCVTRLSIRLIRLIAWTSSVLIEIRIPSERDVTSATECIGGILERRISVPVIWLRTRIVLTLNEMKNIPCSHFIESECESCSYLLRSMVVVTW